MATLFFSPHQDDELLVMGADIVNHIAEGDDVHVILCMNGAGSFVRRYLSKQGTCSFHGGTHQYGITPEEFTILRDNEFRQSCIKLGVKPENIHVYSNRWDDGSLTVAKAREIIQYYMNKFPNSKIKTHTPYGPSSQHPDHKTLGIAALQLYHEGKVYNNDVRFYVEPWLINDWRNVNSGKNAWAVSPSQPQKMADAVNAYKTWNPGDVPSTSNTGEVYKIASNDTLNIRTGPGVSYGIAYTLKLGEEVQVLKTNSNGWVEVRCLEKTSNKGKTGWCNGAYIKRFLGCDPGYSKFAIGYHSVPDAFTDMLNNKNGYVHAPYENVTTEKKGKVHSASQYGGLKIRSTNSTAGSILEIVQDGTILTILDTLSNGWYKVRTPKGTTGYCSGDYVTII